MTYSDITLWFSSGSVRRKKNRTTFEFQIIFGKTMNIAVVDKSRGFKFICSLEKESTCFFWPNESNLIRFIFFFVLLADWTKLYEPIWNRKKYWESHAHIFKKKGKKKKRTYVDFVLTFNMPHHSILLTRYNQIATTIKIEIKIKILF